MACNPKSKIQNLKSASTLHDGMKLERDFLARAGVDVDTISFGGGAGGSRADYVTPAATVQLLRHMAGRPDFYVYEHALPILGVDGTLAKSVKADSPVKGQVQAKTGTLTWDNLLFERSLCTSKAIAGYMTTAKGQRLAFAAFVNGVHMKDGITTTRLGKIWANYARLCMSSGKPTELFASPRNLITGETRPTSTTRAA